MTCGLALASSLKIDLDSLDIEYWQNFLAAPEASELLDRLVRDTPWSQPDLTIYGKRVKMPRLTAWYGDPEARYTYSGIQNLPTAWTPRLREIKGKVEQLVSSPFNSVLLNLYRSGSDSMAWHRDDEPELGLRPAIASLSLGIVRRFGFRQLHRPAIGPRKTYHIDLAHGSLLLMRGDTQQNWEHGISKKSNADGVRINLTFRNIC